MSIWCGRKCRFHVTFRSFFYHFPTRNQAHADFRKADNTVRSFSALGARLFHQMVPPLSPEALARENIDRQLTAAGWHVQSIRDLNLYAGRGIAVREFRLDSGPVDYLLLVDRKAVGVIEA